MIGSSFISPMQAVNIDSKKVISCDFVQVLYSIKAHTVVMITAAKGAGVSPDTASDRGIMTSVALERVVAQATATYNEW